MKKIDIIILHYGEIVVTKKCVESIEKFSKTYRNIYVINNDVRIDINKKLAAKEKRVLINSGENFGFARGVNFGIKIALKDKADYVMLINNDVLVHNDFIKPLVQFLDNNSSASIVSPVIKSQNGKETYYYHGGYINRLTGESKNDDAPAISQKDQIEVESLSGCCMVIKKEVFDKIGFFDEQFFMYYEDVDFCLRARRAHLSMFIVPGSIIEHEGSKSIGKNSSNAVYQLVKSHIKFSKKHKEFTLRYLSIFVQIGKFILKAPSHTFTIIKAVRGI